MPLMMAYAKTSIIIVIVIQPPARDLIEFSPLMLKAGIGFPNMST